LQDEIAAASRQLIAIGSFVDEQTIACGSENNTEADGGSRDVESQGATAVWIHGVTTTRDLDGRTNLASRVHILDAAHNATLAVSDENTCSGKRGGDVRSAGENLATGDKGILAIEACQTVFAGRRGWLNIGAATAATSAQDSPGARENDEQTVHRTPRRDSF